jgi:hypothetical protein
MITFNTVLNFVKAHFKTILAVIFGLFLFYWILFFLTPKVQMDIESKKKIDSLNVHVKEIENEQKTLDTKIEVFGQEITKVENNITKIKSQKETIREIYHEKITSVNSYTDVQLDSFFANRYGYSNYYQR